MRSSRLHALAAPVAGALVLAALACAGPAGPVKPGAAQPDRTAEKLVVSDADGDGKPDTWTWTRNENGKDVVVRREKDLDGDGKPDVWEDLDLEGRVTRQRIDADHDGLPDVTLVFEAGELVRREIAVSGRTRVWQHYEHGQLVRKERDTTGSGRPDTWEEWSNGALRRVGVDRDGDGKPDGWDEARPPTSSAR